MSSLVLGLVQSLFTLEKYDWYEIPIADDVNKVKQHHQVENPNIPLKIWVVKIFFSEFHAKETWLERVSTSSSLPKCGSILIFSSGSTSIRRRKIV